MGAIEQSSDKLATLYSLIIPSLSEMGEAVTTMGSLPNTDRIAALHAELTSNLADIFYPSVSPKAKLGVKQSWFNDTCRKAK